MVVGDIIQGSGSGGAYLRVVDVGDDPPHGPSPGRFPAQGVPMDHRKTSKAAS